MRPPARHARFALVVAASALAVAQGSATADEEPKTDPGTETPHAPRRERAPPTQLDVEVTLINVGLSFAGHLDRDIYLGVGASVLPALMLTTLSKYPIEIYGGHAFLRYDLARVLQVDVGARACRFEEFQLCVFGGCRPPPRGWLLGPYTDLRLGFHHVKFGPRLEYAVRSDTERGGLVFYPLYLRIEATP